MLSLSPSLMSVPPYSKTETNIKRNVSPVVEAQVVGALPHNGGDQMERLWVCVPKLPGHASDPNWLQG